MAPELNSTLSAPRQPRPRSRRHAGWSIRLSCSGMALLVLVNLALLAALAWPILQARLALPTAQVEQTSPATAQIILPDTTPSQTPAATPSPAHTPSATPLALDALPSISLQQGMILLALSEGVDTHLFAYAPEALPLTRLTVGPWDDLSPAVSPDGQHIAFASNRNGYWDIYLLEIRSGIISRLTDSLAYDGAPAWSPDGVWLVYESYLDDNLELLIHPVANDQPPIRLTNDPAADHSPDWSPGGRQIAFVSDRSGEPEIWLADLDQVGESRYQNLSRSDESAESRPVWDRRGASLVWAANQHGVHLLRKWDSAQPDPPRTLGSGDWSAWSPDGETILAVFSTPNADYLTAYNIRYPGMNLPVINLPAAVKGLDWGAVDFPRPLPEPFQKAIVLTPEALWTPVLTPVELPTGREFVVPLPKDIQAPHALLHDDVDEAFLALRSALAEEIGWDALSALENAYVPLTSPLDPGLGNSWLYTGRAFTLNNLPINAGWMTVVREDFNGETYWRVYLRTRYQDGSAGAPLHELVWDFNARFTGDTQAYEQGGLTAAHLPTGYWLDFTDFAAAFGWERVPALSTWRSAYPAARFNEFVLTGGLDWRTAMLALYPPEALLTPTAIIPPTRTPTPTPRWYQTATPTLTASPRPTLTPITPSPTATLTASLTPMPSPTATPTPSPTRTQTLRPTTVRTPRPSPTEMEP